MLGAEMKIRAEMKIEQLQKQIKEQNQITHSNANSPQIPFSGSITKKQTLTLTQNKD